ncbi:MAG: DUF2889 domain-containing protein [Rhodovibrionaceae bacterium]|nr:DUF2889 domain-containing protein [Rhodovibrionaceae bacterium]
MPLPPPVEREHLHTRRYQFEGFQRTDGLWDIEGRIVDEKSYSFSNHDRGTIPAGEALHHMEVRLTVDEDFRIVDVAATTESGPFHACPAIAPNYKKLIGARIGAGWRASLKQLFAGTEGCTHITEMLGAMATVAFQTMWPVLAKRPEHRGTGDKRPPLIDSCHAFSSDGEVVRREWPQYYTGPKPVGAPGEKPAKKAGGGRN